MDTMLLLSMAKQHQIEPLITEIEEVLNLEEFTDYNDSWEFVRGLEYLNEKIDDLVENGEAVRCVPLYEIFLSGCYEKAAMIDGSSGKLGMFFEELFCSWITARQNRYWR